MGIATISSDNVGAYAHRLDVILSVRHASLEINPTFRYCKYASKNEIYCQSDRGQQAIYKKHEDEKYIVDLRTKLRIIFVDF